MKSRMESKMSPPVVIGVDIGKEVFHLVGFGADGKIAFRRRIRRLGLKDAFEKLPPCIVAMEACLSAHFVSRTLRALGHESRIIPAIYVKPFVKGQKNDYNDAEAIAEAALRPNLRFVQEKSQDQPGAVAIGLAANSDDQPNSSLPDRARHCRQDRPARPPQVALRDTGKPKGRDLTPNGQADPRSL
jgi:hypothetical protein